MVSFLSFSFLSSGPAIAVASRVFDQNRHDLLEAKFRNEESESLAKLKETIEDLVAAYPEARAEFSNLVLEAEPGRPMAEWANAWIHEQLYWPPNPGNLIAESVTSDMPDASSDAKSETSSRADSAKSEHARRVPSPGEWKEAKARRAETKRHLERYEHEAQVKCEAVRAVLAKLCEVGLGQVGVMPAKELGDQLAQKLIDMVVDSVPVGQFTERYKALFSNFLARVALVRAKNPGKQRMEVVPIPKGVLGRLRRYRLLPMSEAEFFRKYPEFFHLPASVERMVGEPDAAYAKISPLPRALNFDNMFASEFKWRNFKVQDLERGGLLILPGSSIASKPEPELGLQNLLKLRYGGILRGGEPLTPIERGAWSEFGQPHDGTRVWVPRPSENSLSDYSKRGDFTRWSSPKSYELPKAESRAVDRPLRILP